MHFPNNALYHRESLWLKVQEGDEGIIGVSHFAQENLGEIVYIDLPKPGSSIVMGSSLGTIESHKAVSDLIAPASGIVLGINSRLLDSPTLVNESPYEEGWIVRIRLNDAGETAQLLSADEYVDYLGICS